MSVVVGGGGREEDERRRRRKKGATVPAVALRRSRPAPLGGAPTVVGVAGPLLQSLQQSETCLAWQATERSESGERALRRLARHPPAKRRWAQRRLGENPPPRPNGRRCADARRLREPLLQLALFGVRRAPRPQELEARGPWEPPRPQRSQLARRARERRAGRSQVLHALVRKGSALPTVGGGVRVMAAARVADAS